MPNSKDFNRFSVNPVNIDISRSLFNLDHSVKFSCNVGDVVPFECIEVLPGDTFSIDTSKVVRMQPLVAPLMDEVLLDVYYFFVPNRLVWDHWINFMGENTSGPWAPETDYLVPTLEVPIGGFDVGSVADYLGIPPKVGAGRRINALPFRAYALICDQWFRSEALDQPLYVYHGDMYVEGVNSTSAEYADMIKGPAKGGAPFIACKLFDYFTGALPAPQRGDAVNVFPDTALAPVIAKDGINHPYQPGGIDFGVPGVSYWDKEDDEWYSIPKPGVGHSYYRYLNGGYLDDNRYDSSLHMLGYDQLFETDDTDFRYATFNNLFAQLNSATFNVNDLRTAFAVQKYLEKSARFGGRYQEMIKGFFNVDSPDARLQRTEYLGGNRISLNISQVEQTSATEVGLTPQGNVTGMSVTADMNSDFTKSFTEHGFIIGCSVVRYNHSYQQGVNRTFLRRTMTDYYNPVFANLGEQAISEDEIYFQYPSEEQGVFGYQERWAEYRYLPSRVAGEMRSVSDISLDVWHLGDDYSSKPSLGSSWIREDKANLDRCLAVTSEVANQVICDFYVKTEASRPMPLYSIPGLIDHH